MRPLKIFIPIALLFFFALSLYIGSHVIANESPQPPSSCQGGVFQTSGASPIFPPRWECFYYNYNPPTPFEYDYVQSGVTIIPGGMTEIYIMGGVTPYIWADPGNGYSWASGTTTLGTTNTLVCAPDTGGG